MHEINSQVGLVFDILCLAVFFNGLFFPKSVVIKILIELKVHSLITLKCATVD